MDVNGLILGHRG